MINAQNCIHCKMCDIKDPKQNKKQKLGARRRWRSGIQRNVEIKNFSRLILLNYKLFCKFYFSKGDFAAGIGFNKFKQDCYRCMVDCPFKICKNIVKDFRAEIKNVAL